MKPIYIFLIKSYLIHLQLQLYIMIKIKKKEIVILNIMKILVLLLILFIYKFAIIKLHYYLLINLKIMDFFLTLIYLSLVKNQKIIFQLLNLMKILKK